MKMLLIIMPTTMRLEKPLKTTLILALPTAPPDGN
jgi:hypothetical protein